jgi:hypothetical protein
VVFFDQFMDERPLVVLDMEVRAMHFFSFDRGIIVALCFVLWIAAAGLICWALVPRQLPDDSAPLASPAAVVHAQAAGAATPRGQVSLAQR